MAQTDPDKLRAIAQSLLEDFLGQSGFPWYDSVWLQAYVRATDYLAEHHPTKIEELEALVAPFQTPADFQVQHVKRLLDADQMAAVRAEVRRVIEQPVSIYERERFGRDLMHDRPLFTELQCELAPRVSELVGEEVEPCYNFLSLYGSEGVCEPHMDTPQAKWTLDICIDQSLLWPIHVSPVVPWPTDWKAAENTRWQDQIRQSTTFEPHTMEPGDGIVFAGSSQWHYRDPMPSTNTDDFCHLLFLHYVPAGTLPAGEPENWAELLDVPSLSPVCGEYYDSDQSAKGLHGS